MKALALFLAVAAVVALLLAAPVHFVAADDSAAASKPCPHPVQCFVDPCEVHTCASGRCKSDYCHGGCNARCQCSGKDECSHGEQCGVEGFCVAGLDPAVDPESPYFDRCTVVRCRSLTHCVDGSCIPNECHSDTDCSGDGYCSRRGQCQPKNVCRKPEDCKRHGWQPFIKCLGHFTCEDGQCGYRCGQEEEEPPKEDASCAAVSCLEGSQCVDGRCELPVDDGGAASCAAVSCLEGTHCVNGECLPNEDDTSSCALILCEPDTHCVGGQCVPLEPVPEPNGLCTSSAECLRGQYCSSRGVCLGQFECCAASDCEGRPTSNFMRRPFCRNGRFRCEKGRCRWRCRAEGGLDDSAAAGDTNDETVSCPYEDPCNLIDCATGFTCRDGQCVPRSCGDGPACAESEYCGSEAQCLPQGFCRLPLDCQADPSFIHPLCTGSFSCSEGQCGFACGPENINEPAEPSAPVEVPPAAESAVDDAQAEAPAAAPPEAEAIAETAAELTREAEGHAERDEN